MYVEVIAILAIGLLAAIVLLAAVNSAKITARKVACLNNMKGIELAAQAFASSHEGRLPPLSSSQSIKNSSEEEGEFVASWMFLLLPALDQTELLSHYQANAIVKNGQARLGDVKRPLVYGSTCFHDANAFNVPGRMSYVMNSGFMSQHLYHGDADRKHLPGSLAWASRSSGEDAIGVHAATGAVWHQSDAFVSLLEYIRQGDGTSQTLLVTENLQAGNWYDTDTAKIGFGFPVANTNGNVPLGSGQVFDSTEKPLNTQFKGGTLTTMKSQEWKINANLKAKGLLPRPSSNHAGGVNVIMCDGAAKFLNQSMDPHVYLKLLTANGIVYGEGDLNAGSY